MLTDKLKGKKIVVTGASKGMGMFTVIHLAKEGAIPVIVARGEQRLGIIRKFIGETFGVECITYVADLSDESERKKLLVELKEKHPDIVGLVNNAGFGSFESLQAASWEKSNKMIQLNVTALIHLTQELLPILEENGGHVINVGSQSGKIATPKAAVYTATKHAVVGFTNSLRMETDRVTVTAVNPGPVATSFFEQADPSGGYEASVKAIMLDPNKIARRMVRTFDTHEREINAPAWMEAASKLYQAAPGVMEKAFRSQFNKK
ncbi:SDR family oxidoreductase [Salimicrobium sp. PL1-032A]|uniref:SDR family NAD(P)-dependent oxidoreductase n=1 Tax=Salimicrobium sp. PL1-032A TaxID=3095364 RepID=UPI0032614784